MQSSCSSVVWLLLATGLWFSGSSQGQQPAAPEAATLPQCRTLLEQGRADEAVSSLQAYTAAHPESAAGAYLLGYAFYAAKQPRRSLEQYTRGASLRAPSAEDLMAVSADYILLNDFTDAARWLTTVTSMQPSNSLAWYYLGRAQHLSGRYPEALQAFDRALQIKPQYIRAEIGAGLTKEAMGDSAGAMQAYGTAAQWQGTALIQDAQPYLSAGELLLKQGNNQAALEKLQTAAKFSHANPRVLEDLGKAYERTGNFAGAQAALEQAEHLAPDSSTVHFLLGTAYLHQGQKAKADQEFSLTNGLLSTESNHATENFDLQP